MYEGEEEIRDIQKQQSNTSILAVDYLDSQTIFFSFLSWLSKEYSKTEGWRSIRDVSAPSAI